MDTDGQAGLLQNFLKKRILRPFLIDLRYLNYHSKWFIFEGTALKINYMKIQVCISPHTIILCCMLVPIMLTSCDRQVLHETPDITIDIPEIGDGGFLSQEPCGPPCFWNIVPNITTKDEAIEVLKSKGLFERCEFIDNTAYAGTRGIVCRPIVLVELRDDTDIVSGIGFRPSEAITVEDMIEKYGEPDAVLVSTIGIPEGQYQIGMNLYYDKFYGDIRLNEQDGGTFTLTPSTIIVNIGYADEAWYSEVRNRLQQWKGYGEYKYQSPK